METQRSRGCQEVEPSLGFVCNVSQRVSVMCTHFGGEGSAKKRGRSGGLMKDIRV